MDTHSKQGSKPTKEKATITSQHSQPAWLAFLLRPRTILIAILLLGTIIRVWGIWDRHFNDSDTSSAWNAAELINVTWKWFQTGAYKIVPLMDFKEQTMGNLCYNDDNAKPLHLMFRSLIIAITGQRSIIGFSLLDIAFAVGAMAFMLRWCLRALGLRMAVLAGCLWLVCGSQFIDSGRGYDYSSVTFFFTAALCLVIGRGPERLYRTMFLAGVFLSLAVLSHIKLVLPFLPCVVGLVVLWKNPQGIRGKILEMLSFGIGFVVPLAIMFLYYRGFALLTGVEWGYALPRHMREGEIDGGPLSERIRPLHLINDWFEMSYINGAPFLLAVILGVLVATVLHFRRHRLNLWLFNDQLFALTAFVGFGGLFWGCYYYKCPRNRMVELSAWPVLAAVGVNYATYWVSRFVLKGRFLTGIQVVLVLAIVANQWVHTAPMIKMGSGMRRAFEAISKEGKTAIGEGDFQVWPCTMKINKPIQPSPWRWDVLDDFVETNKYDYFYLDYARVLSFIITYPGAGQILMLDTYNRLVGNVEPVWHFEYGAPIHAGFEHDRTDWFKQFYRWDVWRAKYPSETPYDKLAMNVNYFDVFRASDVIRANRQSRIQLLAQLIALQRKNPSEFQRAAPRFQNFIRYNATNQVIMRQAEALAAKF